VQHPSLQAEVVKLTQQLMGVKLEPSAPMSASVKPKATAGSFSSTITSTQSDGPSSLLDSDSETKILSQ